MNKKNLMINIILVAAILLLISQLTKNNMLFALAFPFVSVPWMCIGAMKKDSVRGVAKYSLLALLIIWLITFTAMTKMDSSKVLGYFWGLPNGTAIMIYATWLLPFFVVTLVYALRFEKDYITKEDLTEFTRTTGINISLLDGIKKDERNINI